ncbi:leucyl/phenylalanyl-tRNA--protein transferase [Kushneria aurantia]|uniref:Leucyl/phenylalanyl-tRNA--protein transferase n=1 Tax=Kushneria aurantia TaxID=504092 RepID=A0ABV6G3S8_9GAMM|nr:leucyl/phenylalanyl-tRNA--protein transferase [Kushneria aurantia]
MIDWLDPANIGFPDLECALEEPDGLLAVGGDLSPEWLICAYRRGIFPWFSADQPILWWSPDPRMVLFPDELRVRRSLAKRLRNAGFTISFDRAFDAVIDQCAALRASAEGTWISPRIKRAYSRLHALGHAHSVEVWESDALVGGLYGVRMGRVFFGESMFSRRPDASKIALVELVRCFRERFELAMIDCQVHTDHLQRMGAREIARRDFTSLLERYIDAEAI